MKPRINVITITVTDLEKSVAFYRDGLGWPTDGIIGKDIEGYAVAFFDLQNGLRLALWPQDALARDSTVSNETPNNPTSFSLGHNVNSREEVDAVFAQAVAAGAKVVDPARDRPWGGYNGYFQDLDGHLWDVVWNPDLTVED